MKRRLQFFGCIALLQTPSVLLAQRLTDQPQFFFDARSTGFTKDGAKQYYDGDVIAIGPQSLMTADKVTIDEKRKYILAEGHVIVLSNGQFVTGEKVELWTDTTDLRVTNAILVINDSAKSEKITKQVLGFTASEVEFEAQREVQLKELNKKKDAIRAEVREATKAGMSVDQALVRQYSIYLEQESLMLSQENPAFAQMAEARRQTLKRRREFWEQARLQERVKPSGQVSYFRLSGDVLEKTNQNDLFARNGLWTPCLCEDDEDPAWALRSSRIFAQPGGYATFSHAVVEVKGIPVLYLPWFRIPIKDRRQSGFLTPTFTSDAQSGSVASQPFYLNLSDDRDATIKAENFERRGTKLGLEYRYLRRKDSGFQLNVEMMRDRYWLTQKANREDLRGLYLSGLSAAGTDTSGAQPQDISGYTGRDYASRRARQRSYWEANHAACLSADPVERKLCEESLLGPLKTPDIDTRGLLKWSGRERVTDRLSVVTAGEVFSDRHYNADLYVPEGLSPDFETGNGERALQPSKLQWNFDHRNGFVGHGTEIYDNVRLNDRFEGYQTPSILRGRSRYYSLSEAYVPIYAAAEIDQIRVTRLRGAKDDLEATTSFLPSAWWRRFSLNVVSPISTKGAVQVDHFTRVEGRYISPDQRPQEVRHASSSINSLRTGFRLQLPIDGRAVMPSWMEGDAVGAEEGTRYLQHTMNWSVTFSARPSVVRQGPYGESFNSMADLRPRSYYATDFAGSDDNIFLEDYMEPHQLVTFETLHRWKIFSEVWRQIAPGEVSADGTVTPNKKVQTQDDNMSWEERARRELLYSNDKPVTKLEDIVNEDQSKWFINRYQLLDTDYLEPVTLWGKINYDYYKESRRRKEGKSRDNRPWSEAELNTSVSAYRWVFADQLKYDIYDKLATKHSMSLTAPTFLRSNASIGFTVEKTAVDRGNRTTDFVPTIEKTAGLSTSITSPVITTYNWGHKERRDTVTTADYRQKMTLSYASPSNCWALGFSREKDYFVAEQNATYLLQFSMVFSGQNRNFDISPSLTRELKKDES